MDKLSISRVAIFGIGGVGTFVAEALARCGIGNFALFDNDIVSQSNINRQLIATSKTIGRNKVEVMAERIKEINPNAKVATYKVFYMPDIAEEYDLTLYDYIVDVLNAKSGFMKSNGEARRALNENSISINREKVQEGFTLTTTDLINNQFVLLQRGKKNYFVLNVQ